MAFVIWPLPQKVAPPGRGRLEEIVIAGYIALFRQSQFSLTTSIEDFPQNGKKNVVFKLQ
ncbi:MAG: hypothetical protein JRC68_01550 [Deltaproteobacteria bacterium]|nr:hypothetical protein [Deltaproteobacteria bacterium]